MIPVLLAALVISGHVTDDCGRPVRPHTVVSAITPSGFIANSGVTDANGAYTIRDLPPGLYTITAIGGTLPPSANPGCTECCRPATDLVTTRYPSLVNRSATRIDIKMRRLPVYCVRGRITDVLDRPLKDAGVSLAWLEYGGDHGSRGSGVIVENGRFLLTHLPPGRYKLAVARERGRFAPILAERTFEIRDRNIDPLVITINSGPRIP